MPEGSIFVKQHAIIYPATSYPAGYWPEDALIAWLADWHDWQTYCEPFHQTIPAAVTARQYALVAWHAFATGQPEEAHQYLKQGLAALSAGAASYGVASSLQNDTFAKGVLAALQARLAYTQQNWEDVAHYATQAYAALSKTHEPTPAAKRLTRLLLPYACWWCWQAAQQGKPTVKRLFTHLHWLVRWAVQGLRSPYASSLGALILGLTQLSLTRKDQTQALKYHLLALHKVLPGFQMAYDALAHWHLHHDDIGHKQALHWLQKCTVRFPNHAPGWLLQAQLYENMADADNAILCYQRAITILPTQAEAQLGLGRLYMGHQLQQQAVPHLKQALMFSTHAADQAECFYLLGQAYLVMDPDNRCDLAEHLLRQACDLSPANAQYHYILAMWLFHQGRHAEAEVLYRQMMLLTPGDAMLTCSLGYLCALQGNVEEAKHLYEQAILLDPNYDVAYNNLGVLYLEHFDEPETAQSLFAQAVDCNMDYAAAHYNLGRTYRQCGQVFEAAASMQWARELSTATHELDDTYLERELHQLFKAS